MQRSSGKPVGHVLFRVVTPFCDWADPWGQWGVERSLQERDSRSLPKTLRARKQPDPAMCHMRTASENAMSGIIPFVNQTLGHSENLEASLSITLSSIFRGRLCRTLLQDRSAQTFQKGEAIYEMGQQKGA